MNKFFCSELVVYLQRCWIDDTQYRVPSMPVAEPQAHQSGVNGIAWAPHSSCHICSAGDDKQALIWDLSAMPSPIEGRQLSRGL